MSGNLKFHLSALSNSRTVGANVDDSIDSVAIWNVSWRNAVVEGKREAAREQHYLVLFGPSTGNPSLFGPSYVRRALLCFSSYTYLVLCCAVLCCDVLIIVMLITVTIYSIIIIKRMFWYVLPSLGQVTLPNTQQQQQQEQ